MAVSMNSLLNTMKTAETDFSKAANKISNSDNQYKTYANGPAQAAQTTRMDVQLEGLGQAISNADAGRNMITVMEGALEQVESALVEIRNRAENSATGTTSALDRKSNQAVVKQMIDEINRISETTKYNGMNLLDGTQKDLSFQVGASSNETIALEVGKIDAKTLGGMGADIIGATGGADLLTTLKALSSGANGMVINGQSINSSQTLSSAANLEDALDVINNNLTGVEVGLHTELAATTAGDGVIQGTDHVQFTLTMANDKTSVIQINGTGSMDELVAAINEKGAGDLTASVDDQGKLVLSSDTIQQIDVAVSGITADTALGVGISAGKEAVLTLTDEMGSGLTVSYGTNAGALVDDLGIASRLVEGQVTAGSTSVVANFDQGDLTINGVEIGEFKTTLNYDGITGNEGSTSDLVAHLNSYSEQTGVTVSLGGTGMNLLQFQSQDGSEVSIDYRAGQETAMAAVLGMRESNAAQSAGGNVASIDVSSVAGAQKAIDIVDAAIESLSDQRGSMGATSIRLDMTSENLSNVKTATSDARDGIAKPDLAEAAMEMADAQIRTQASNAMVAQAKAANQQVLSLLQ